MTKARIREFRKALIEFMPEGMANPSIIEVETEIVKLGLDSPEVHHENIRKLFNLIMRRRVNVSKTRRAPKIEVE